MVQLAADKKRIFALLLVWAGTLQAALAQELAFRDGSSIRQKQLANYFPMMLKEETRNPTAPPSNTQRFVTPLHSRVLDIMRDVPFLGVFEFPRLEGRHISNFAVRPRTLLFSKGAWYATPNKYGGRWVYVTMQLPKKKDKFQQPKVVIDVECDNCDLSRVQMSYGGEFSAAFLAKEYMYYHLLDQIQTPTKDARIVKLESPRKVGGQVVQEIAFDRKFICSGPYGAAVWVPNVPSLARTATFHWVSGGNSGNTPLQSFEVDVGVHHRFLAGGYVPFKPHREAQDFCNQKSNTKVVLQIRYKRKYPMRLDSALVYWLKPDIPLGAGSEAVAHVSTTFRSDRGSSVCVLAVEGDKLREVKALGKRAVFRFWRSSSTSCSEPVGRVLRELEAQVTSDSVDQPIRATQCVCEGLKGRVYRLLDGGPVSDDWNDPRY